MIRTFHASFLFAVIACGLCGTAQAVTFNVFTDPHPPNGPMGPGTIGFAYAGNKFVGSVLQNGTGSLYSTDLNGGNVQVFAPAVSLISANQEHFVAASFGLGGFPNGDIYAANGPAIVHITNAGTSSNTFVSGLAGDVRGITFDQVGTFANNMLVTTNSGNVYMVTSGGSATLLANVGEDVEGLDVAPLGYSFNSLNGQLIVASEGSGMLRAISPAGAVTPLSNGSLGPVLVHAAEELTFVPLNLGASGSPLEGLYGANYTPDVLKANYTEFLGMQGDIIVTSETVPFGSPPGTLPAVSRVHWDSGLSQFVVSQVGTFPNQPEDGVFVTPTMITPEPSSIALAVAGVLALLAWRWRS